MSFEQALLDFIQNVYSFMQWPGVVVLMAIESACIPVPSEIIMPLAGWMLIKQQSLPAVYTLVAAFYGTVGCTIGSLGAYAVGLWGGRRFLEKYGKFVLVSHEDLAQADRWFYNRGNWAIFISRLLPVVRTFISLPAGIARMNLAPFLILTFAGSFPWCLGLAYGGYLLGEHWEEIRAFMRPFDPVIIILILGLVGLYIFRRVRALRAR